jgi:hypothetical protein
MPVKKSLKLAVAHALLSASSSKRWLSCPPSARIEEKIPGKTSAYAEEGTKAHALAEKMVNAFLQGKPLKRRPKDVDGEMWEAVNIYADLCIEKINEARKVSIDAEVHVEERLDYSPWVPEGFGTGDMVLISDNTIEVIDLKYGKGVPVSAQGNTQMRLYALGLYNAYGMLYGADEVRMTICQPRLNSISTDTMPVSDLLAWGESIRTTAEMAYKGEGERCAGDHCKFCKAAPTCRKLAEYELEAVKESTKPDELTDVDIVEIIRRSDSIKKWLTAVEEFALHAATVEGIAWPGLKVVEGRSVRKIADEGQAKELLLGAGFTADDFMKPQELKTITALEKLVGKKKFGELMADVITKPPGKPTLVDESDKRPAMDLETVKAEDFDDSLL